MMVWLAVLIVIFFTVAAYLLFAPFYLEADSRRRLFRIRLHRLAGARIFLEDSLYMEVNIAWWNKTFDLLSLQQRRKPQVKKEKAKRKKKSISLRKIRAVVQTFKVNKMELNMDTGDNYLNGILFPWLQWAALRMRRSIRMNFTGENDVVIEIENNMARMLWAFIIS